MSAKLVIKIADSGTMCKDSNFVRLFFVIIILFVQLTFAGCDFNKNEKRDKYRELNKLALSSFVNKNYEDSLKYANEALNLNYKDDDEFLSSYITKSVSLYKLKKLKESVEFFDKAYKVLKRRKDLRGMASKGAFFLRYSIAVEFFGDVPKAKQILLDSFEYGGDPYFIYFRLACLEAVYYRNYGKSLEYFRKAQETDPPSFEGSTPEKLLKQLKKSNKPYIIYLNKFI